MKRNLYYLILLLAAPFLAVSCNSGKALKEEERRVESQELKDRSSAELLAINASQYGMKYPETFILMQNRMGLRIEYNLDRSNLQIWISPQAGKSFSYVDKNWSNRDDHTNVFDRILLPGLSPEKFDSCNWDPFHSIIYFEDQTLHISQIYDKPAVLVWFEKPGKVDFKIYGETGTRDRKSFIMNHSDRSRDFQSAALLSEGDGYFRHQPVLDRGRSTHARAHLAPGQVLLIASELEQEQIGHAAAQWVNIPVDEVLGTNEAMIHEDLRYGLFSLKERPEMQKLLDKSRRVALSMQDFKGFMRSTNQYIYYLLWYRDGGMNVSHIAYSGWPQPAFDNTRFALLNPNVSNSDPEGKFFGQVMGGPITKWQEDGLFYVVWPAFTHWTLTGDKSLCEGENLQTMEDAMEWLEDYCYDEEKGLFGRYYACETPMTGSRGDGWDHATGAPANKWESEYEGQTIVRSYDIYVNFLHYSTYLMLSMMQEDDEKAGDYLAKANRLEENMIEFLNYNDRLPSYGKLLTEDGRLVTAKPYGMDNWDYVWGLSLPPFTPNKVMKYKELREALREDMTQTREGYFLCVYFALLTSMDTEIHDEDSIVSAMDALVPYSIRPGKYLPMAYSMPEMFNIPDGDPFHDVRPLVYSIAPWLSAVTNLGMRKLPFGLAVRGTGYLDSLNNYFYKNSFIDVHFKGKGPVNEVLINGKPLINSYQIPEDMLKEGKNEIKVGMESSGNDSDILISSTLQMKSVQKLGKGTEFKMQAYGKNILTFKNLRKSIQIRDENGDLINFTMEEADNLKIFEFSGRGEVKIFMN